MTGQQLGRVEMPARPFFIPIPVKAAVTPLPLASGRCGLVWGTAPRNSRVPGILGIEMQLAVMDYVP